MGSCSGPSCRSQKVAAMNLSSFLMRIHSNLFVSFSLPMTIRYKNYCQDLLGTYKGTYFIQLILWIFVVSSASWVYKFNDLTDKFCKLSAIISPNIFSAPHFFSSPATLMTCMLRPLWRSQHSLSVCSLIFPIYFLCAL